jgi:hypothetical protein
MPVSLDASEEANNFNRGDVLFQDDVRGTRRDGLQSLEETFREPFGLQSGAVLESKQR